VIISIDCHGYGSNFDIILLLRWMATPYLQKMKGIRIIVTIMIPQTVPAICGDNTAYILEPAKGKVAPNRGITGQSTGSIDAIGPSQIIT
jgi:hypothetical protein